MARRQDVQSADGVISSLSPFGIVDVIRSTAPVNLKPGFARGCTYRYVQGAAGTSLFVNIGDHTSSVWVSVDAVAANYNPVPRVVTAENTVGNTTLTAAAVVGGIINRGGTQVGGFTDTFPTGTLIQAALGQFVAGPAGSAGLGWELVYRNTTGQTATLAGGTGSTLSNITSVATNTTARFWVTLTGTNTVTIAGLSSGAST